MECERARAAMLECEPQELEGIGETDLAAHLRACASCRRRAATLAADLRALGAALEAMAGGRGRAEADIPGVRDAGALAGVGESGGSGGDRVRGLAAGVAGDARWQRLWRLSAPLAAAAAVAALVLAWPGGGSAPGRRADRSPAEVPASGGAAHGPELRVRVPADARVAVFQTRDPSVAVVWFFPAQNGG